MLIDPEWDPAPLSAALADPGRGEATLSAIAILRVNRETAARPVLIRGDDGETYWAKWPGNPHGPLSMAHEWVVAGIGLHLAAPLPPTRLVSFQEELVRGQSVDGLRLPAGVWVGSRLVEEGVEAEELLYPNRGDNRERIPRYLALWHLCLGQDEQFVYEQSERDRLWSIDHGLWFDCHEGDWTPASLTAAIPERWSPPQGDILRFLQVDDLLDAAARVEQLGVAAIGAAVGSVPVQWRVTDETLSTLAQFIHARRGPAAEHLRYLATQTKRRSK